jgi:hypothetical protein
MLSYSIMAAFTEPVSRERVNEIRERLDLIHLEIKDILDRSRERRLTNPEFERVVALKEERKRLVREEADIRKQLAQIHGPTAEDVKEAQVRERAEQIAVQVAEMRQAEMREAEMREANQIAVQEAETTQMNTGGNAQHGGGRTYGGSRPRSTQRRKTRRRR